jgi:hypothetical protein
VCRRPSSSQMLSLRSSPSVLTLGCPHRALSRVHFVRSCLPLAPLPLPYVGTRLPLSCCRRPHHSGRCPFSSPMAPALSSSAVGFSAVERWLGQTTIVSPCGWVGVTCAGCVAHPRLPAVPAHAVAPVPPCARDLLHGRSIWYCLSLFSYRIIRKQ